MKPFSRIAFSIFGCTAIALCVIGDVQTRHFRDIYSLPQALPPAPFPVAIILGASVIGEDTPSDALRDRLLVGLELYRRGTVEKLLVTGDDGGNRSNEVVVMKNFLLNQGVPEEAILVDPRGYRTYESCKRAISVFHVTRAIVITQRFHLARALYLCNQLGVESVGVTADLQLYRRIVFFWVRDLTASAKAWWDIHIAPPDPPVVY